MTGAAARFAAAYALLRAAADLADHWVQSDRDAQAKAATDQYPVTTISEATGIKTVHRTREGRRACAWHVATYTATQAAALTIGDR